MVGEPREQPDSHSAGLSALELASLWVERPVRRIVGSNRLNPLPHAGPISVFLLGVVVVSGLYITLFFQFGHDASYESVAAMEAHAIQRVVRALHRYASAALVVTTVIHGWRVLAHQRFIGRLRRWRWATGLAALLFVWLAGVTGYWLVWDARAQALSEATIGLLGSAGAGQSLSVRQLSGAGAGSGSGFLLVLWFAHLALTVVIGWFSYRHLRRSKLPWLPPPHWMILMGAALLLVSLAVPLGMLPPSDPDRLLADMPLDPFVLFLLPPLLTDWRWVAVIAGAVLLVLISMLPRLLTRREPAPVTIDEDACVGCELCVVDCPYDALTMVPPPSRAASSKPSTDPTHRAPDIAQVDPRRCVSCGICIGSCAFDAIDLPGHESRPPIDVAGRHIVVACDRHVTLGNLDDGDANRTVMPVGCAGTFAPREVRELMDAGAADVQLVGCPPSDCRFGIGNRLASERLSGDRAPRLPRRWTSSTTQDWVSPTDLTAAVRSPGRHPVADPGSRPTNRERYIGAGLLVLGSIVAIAFATRAPFASPADRSGLRVVVDHVAGRALEAEPEKAVGSIDAIEVELDGDVVGRLTVDSGGSQSIGLADWDLEPGATDVLLTATSGNQTIKVYDQAITLEPGQRLVVPVVDVPPDPGADEGERVFASRAAGCTVCHSVEPGDDGVGPSLAGVASAAEGRVEGLTAELYLRQSILLPDQYIVEGWPAGQMLPIYRDRLTEDEIDALVAYLMTLSEESDG